MIELRRPPWYAAPMFLLCALAVTVYSIPWASQLAQGFEPEGAWRVQVGSQAFAVRFGPQAVTQAAPAPITAADGYELTTEAELWAYDLATRLGNPAPSFETIMFLVAWQRAEGGTAGFNPLNTTQEMPGHTCYNSLPSMPCGVKNYPSRDVGLEATVKTLRAGFSGYADIEAGIAANDPERALSGLHVASWGTNAATVETIYRAQVSSSPSQATTISPSQAMASSVPISVDRSTGFGWNVAEALDANGGALRDVVIQPGERWSFNATIGNPHRVAYVKYAGVLGGGVCDLAARYLTVGRQLGLTPAFEHHGIQLNGVPWEDSIAIWSTDGSAGSDGVKQDLELTNTLDRPVRLRTVVNGASVTIEGSME
jgi:hypothetical protein